MKIRKLIKDILKKSSFILFLLIFKLNAQNWTTQLSTPFASSSIDFVCRKLCTIPGHCDFFIQKNTVIGEMWVKVDHQCSDTTFFSNMLIFQKLYLKNKFLEFRFKGDTVFSSKIIGYNTRELDTINPSYGGMIFEKHFSYDKKNQWQIIFIDLRESMFLNRDSINGEIRFYLPNGNFSYDYYLIGDVATPQKPKIDSIRDTTFNAAGLNAIFLSGICIPGIAYSTRRLEGLKIDVSSMNNAFGNLTLSDIDTVFYSGSYGSLNAKLIFDIAPTNAGDWDSIFINLRDTIRNTTTKVAFKVNISSSLQNETTDSRIKIFPTITASTFTVQLDDGVKSCVNILNSEGKSVFLREYNDEVNVIDIGDLSHGTYFVKITNGTENRIFKIIKE